MDLRMVKTRKQIRESFLILRQKFMPENIRVKDICQVAMINKTTFYNHYTDSAQLSNEIDDSAIDKIISSFIDRDKLFEDPRAYIVGLMKAFENESNTIKIVFRGKFDIFCAKLESRLREFYDNKVSDSESKLGISFAIGGCVRAVQDYMFKGMQCDIKQFTEATTNMLEKLLNFNQSKATIQNV